MTETTEDLLARLAGFTPGPWGTDTGGEVHKDGTTIFGWPTWVDQSNSGEIYANMLLGAAAPDLHRIACEQAAEIARLRGLVESVDAYRVASKAEMILPADRGGMSGPKGQAVAETLRRKGAMFAARAALQVQP